MQLKPKVTVMGVPKVEFRAKLNIYIYLHHPGQYMDVDSKTKVMFFPFLSPIDVQNISMMEYRAIYPKSSDFGATQNLPVWN